MDPTCSCPRKTDRMCNNPGCGQRLTEYSPNWFQGSEQCRREVFEFHEELCKRREGTNYDE